VFHRQAGSRYRCKYLPETFIRESHPCIRYHFLFTSPGIFSGDVERIMIGNLTGTGIFSGMPLSADGPVTGLSFF
jgi:hypothetical protein